MLKSGSDHIYQKQMLSLALGVNFESALLSCKTQGQLFEDLWITKNKKITFLFQSLDKNASCETYSC